MKPVLALVSVAALGAVAGTIYVGSQVREDTVVDRPYEEGLRTDDERRGREAAGLSVAIEEVPAAGRSGQLAFVLRGANGPVEGAKVTLTLARPETGRGQLTASAAPTDAAGRAAAPVSFPEPGPWEVRFEIAGGPTPVRLTRTVAVPRGCDLGGAPCTLALGDGLELAVELGPRPLRTMAELAVRAELRRGGAPVDGAAVRVAFSMPGMTMGENAVALAPAGGGAYAGKAVLVRCPSGERRWRATFEVRAPGGPAREAAADLAVAE